MEGCSMLACPSVPGPPALGRGVVLQHGDNVPPAWKGRKLVRVTESVLSDPGPVVTALHQAWVTREPVIVVLEVDPARFRDPLSVAEEPWRLGARFELWLDRLHFLVWTNNYDARGGKPPTWWWSHKARKMGARELADGRDLADGRCGDVMLPDGAAAWIDGGPRVPFERSALGAVVIHRESVELGRMVRPDVFYWKTLTEVFSALAKDVPAYNGMTHASLGECGQKITGGGA